MSSNNSVFVNGLSNSTTLDVLKNIFRKFGPQLDIYIPKDFYTGESRGFAYIQFEDPKDAEDAVREMNNSEIDGKEILCEKVQRKRKKSIEISDGEEKNSK